MGAKDQNRLEIANIQSVFKGTLKKQKSDRRDKETVNFDGSDAKARS